MTSAEAAPKNDIPKKFRKLVKGYKVSPEVAETFRLAYSQAGQMAKRRIGTLDLLHAIASNPTAIQTLLEKGVDIPFLTEQSRRESSDRQDFKHDKDLKDGKPVFVTAPLRAALAGRVVIIVGIAAYLSKNQYHRPMENSDLLDAIADGKNKAATLLRSSINRDTNHQNGFSQLAELERIRA